MIRLLILLLLVPLAAIAGEDTEEFELTVSTATASSLKRPVTMQPAVAATQVERIVETIVEVPAGVGTKRSHWTDHLVIGGYVQAQYATSQLSQDELQQGGQVLNQDRFMVRRGRVRLDGRWDWTAVQLELDGNTTRGASFGVRRAEAAFVWRNPGHEPWLHVGAGLVDQPFGGELRQGQDELLFMERSTGSLTIFPGPPDTGVRVLSAWGALRLSAAVTGGVPLDDRAGAAPVDPTRAPELLGRVGVAPDLGGDIRLEAGLSFLTGTGFSPGSQATKNRVEWRDENENSAIDGGELVAIPGSAARPSKTFGRWAANVDALFGGRTGLGWSQLFLEATLASNLDRGLFVADPVFAARDFRHLSAVAAFTQQLGEYAFAGLRADVYVPDLDAYDDRRGQRLALDSTITTLSPLVGARYANARLALQYDRVFDALARDVRGVPSDVANDRLTLRVQVAF